MIGWGNRLFLALCTVVRRPIFVVPCFAGRLRFLFFSDDAGTTRPYADLLCYS